MTAHYSKLGNTTKKIIIGLALATGMTACTRQTPDANEPLHEELSIPVTSVEKPSTQSTNASPLAWEIYINKFVVSPTNGCVLRSVTGFQNPNGKASSRVECGDTGGPIYEATIEIPDKKENHYSITVTHPIGGGRTAFTRDVIFKGEEIEFYRDDKWRIGIRSDSQSQKSDVAAP